METLDIPNSELRPSRIGLGTWAIGGWMWGGSDDANAVHTIHAAVDRGITLIDTAPVYGFGRSEEIVGRALAEGGRRERVVLATKCALDWGPDGKPFRNASRDAASPRKSRTCCAASAPMSSTSTRCTGPIRRRPSRRPRVRWRRCCGRARSGRSASAISRPSRWTEFRKFAPLHTAQPPYNLFERGIEADVLPYCRDQGIATLTYGALCRGLLSGRMSAETRFEGDDLRQFDPKFRQPRFAQYLAAVQRLDDFAQERFGKRVIHLALRWLLDRPGVSVALWGARKPAQLDPVDQVMGWHLDEAAMAEIESILAECVPQPIGPEFMAPPLKRPQAA